MRWRSACRLCLALAAVLLLPAACFAAAPSSQDWPCIQRKVSEITLAAIWAGKPFDAQSIQWRSDPEIADLVERLAARRTSDEEARAAVASLAASAGTNKRAELQALLAGLLETLNAERNEIIVGLERRGRSQKQLAEDLRNEEAKLDALKADPDADKSKIAEMDDQYTWGLRIFDERQKSTRFVCEVPSLVEQRLFMLARAIQGALQ
jgi:hypothetical protein